MALGGPVAAFFPGCTAWRTRWGPAGAARAPAARPRSRWDPCWAPCCTLLRPRASTRGFSLFCPCGTLCGLPFGATASTRRRLACLCLCQLARLAHSKSKLLSPALPKPPVLGPSLLSTPNWLCLAVRCPLNTAAPPTDSFQCLMVQIVQLQNIFSALGKPY